MGRLANIPSPLSSGSEVKTNSRLNALLITLLLLEGFISLSSEVLAIRQISIFSGTNIDVVSVIIGIYLLSLAYGYAAGGKLRSGIRKRITRNLLIAATGYAFVFSFGLLFAVDRLFESRWLFVIFVSLIGVFPIGFVTSQTVPLITNYMRRGHIGEISARVLFISTAGSFAASIIVPVLLIQWIGVAATVGTLAGVILLMILLLTKRAATRIAAIGIFAVTIVLNPVNPTFYKDDRSLHVVSDNSYATTSILETPKERILMVNRSHSSILPTSPGALPPAYIRTLREIISGLEIEMNILVIGAGGFSISNGDSRNRYTHVDINPDLQKITEEDFLKHPIAGEFIAEDAFVWLRRESRKFDMIIIDAYQTRISMPPLLTTKEFYALARDHLENNGWVAANIIQENPMSEGDRTIDATIRTSFDNCFTTPMSYYASPVSVIYMCQGKRKNEQVPINTLDRIRSASE